MEVDYEFRLPGRHIIMTMEPENIKAVLATQFHEFGKGEEFHQRWQWVWQTSSEGNTSFLETVSLLLMDQSGRFLGLSFDLSLRSNGSLISKFSSAISVKCCLSCRRMEAPLIFWNGGIDLLLMQVQIISLVRVLAVYVIQRYLTFHTKLTVVWLCRCVYPAPRISVHSRRSGISLAIVSTSRDSRVNGRSEQFYISLRRARDLDLKIRI